MERKFRRSPEFPSLRGLRARLENSVYGVLESGVPLPMFRVRGEWAPR